MTTQVSVQHEKILYEKSDLNFVYNFLNLVHSPPIYMVGGKMID